MNERTVSPDDFTDDRAKRLGEPGVQPVARMAQPPHNEVIAGRWKPEEPVRERGKRAWPKPWA